MNELVTITDAPKFKVLGEYEAKVIRCYDGDTFFEQYPDIKIDIAFIDADHCFDSAKRDFMNVLERLNKHGIIICHDTDPISQFYTDPGYCGDSYKLVDYIYSNHPELNILTLPVTETGISIIMRKDDRRIN